LDAVSEYTTISRDARGPGVWENFEYVTVLAHDWDAKYPSTYLRPSVASSYRPSGAARLEHGERKLPFGYRGNTIAQVSELLIVM
jgi:hypothetical protein